MIVKEYLGGGEFGVVFKGMLHGYSGKISSKFNKNISFLPVALKLLKGVSTCVANSTLEVCTYSMS